MPTTTWRLVVLSDGSATGRVDAGLAAIAYTDISTGEFAVDGALRTLLQAELARLQPAEIIQPDGQTLPEESPRITSRRGPPGASSRASARRPCLAHFKAATLDGFGLKGRRLAVRAAGAIVQYLERHAARRAASFLTGLRLYSLDEFMTLDASTRRNLELEQTLRGERHGSLLGLIDRTVTPMGGRMMQQWVSQPLLDADAIRSRQDSVQFFVDRGMCRAELRDAASSR